MELYISAELSQALCEFDMNVKFSYNKLKDLKRPK